MALEEAIEMLRGMQNKKVDYAEIVCAPAFAYGYEYVYPEPEDYAIEEAIKTLKEIGQYREIGTVEECREAVEKQKLKKPVKDKYNHNCCPNCGWIVSGEGGYGEEFCPHCENCGQAIRWENLGEMEDERD